MSRNKLMWIMPVFILGSAACGVNPNDTADENAATSGHFVKIGKVSTFLKKRAVDSGSLASGSEKCTLYKNSTYPTQAAPKLNGNYYEINLRSMIPGCGFSKGFVFVDHVESTSSVVALGGDGMSARTRAFLDVIAFAEGTNDNYNVRFGHYTFSGYARHPRLIFCENSLCSDAAGRYQFLSTTWDMVARALGLRDFSPPNQDRGALYLMRSRGVSNTSNIYSYSQFSSAIYRLNNEWASLPGSPYGQPTRTMAALWAKFQQSVAKY